MTGKMSGPGAGFEYPPVEVSWLKRDVLLFAVSIGATVDELPFVFVSFCSEPNGFEAGDAYGSRNRTLASKSFLLTPQSSVCSSILKRIAQV
jgi:hypothetical protein